ncbi:MAG: LytTR family DNA-binding domain-containing protein [Bacteroidota bacterium]
MEEMTNNSIKHIVLKTATGFAYFDYNDIIICSADGNCSNIFSTENVEPIKILHNLSFIERKYCNDLFIRCHKSHIINLIHLEKLIIKSHHVQLKRNFVVPLSENCWKKIREMSEKCI